MRDFSCMLFFNQGPSMHKWIEWGTAQMLLSRKVWFELIGSSSLWSFLESKEINHNPSTLKKDSCLAEIKRRNQTWSKHIPVRFRLWIRLHVHSTTYSGPLGAALLFWVPRDAMSVMVGQSNRHECLLSDGLWRLEVSELSSRRRSNADAGCAGAVDH